MKPKCRQGSTILCLIFCAACLVMPGFSQARKQARPGSARAPASPSWSIDELRKLQAVLQTSKGDIVIEFFPDKAPAHVRYFANLAKSGFYQGTTFHRVVLRGIIQGGDPISKDPSKRALYGTGGLKKLKAEFNDTPHTRGIVSAVLLPGDPDSAGSQFFICVSDQPHLNGKYTAWGKVVDGMDVVDKISAVPADAEQLAEERIEIKNIVLRPVPPPQPVPFAQASKEEMKNYHAVLQTTFGRIELEFFPEIAPEHVRNFLRLAKLGFYDNTVWHRIVPGFVIQGGDLSTRTEPLSPEQMDKFVKNLQVELSELKHEKGTLSMARAEALDSASTSFFICLASQPALDGKYTIFGKVVSGMDIVDQIGSVATFDNEKPKQRIDLIKVEVMKKGD